MVRQKNPRKAGNLGRYLAGRVPRRCDVNAPKQGRFSRQQGRCAGMAWSGFAYNFCIESKTLLLVRGAFHLREPCDVGTHISQMRPKLRIYLSDAGKNQSHRFAPKTAPKRVWNGSALCSTLLYTWDKIRSEPWYAIPPNPTKQHCNAQFLDFS